MAKNEKLKHVRSLRNFLEMVFVFVNLIPLLSGIFLSVVSLGGINTSFQLSAHRETSSTEEYRPTFFDCALRITRRDIKLFCGFVDGNHSFLEYESCKFTNIFLPFVEYF